MDEGWSDVEIEALSVRQGEASVEQGSGKAESVGETSDDEAHRRHAQWADNTWAENGGLTYSCASLSVAVSEVSRDGWDDQNDSDRTVQPSRGSIQLAPDDKRPKRLARYLNRASDSDNDALPNR
jgi:hypothetical protein